MRTREQIEADMGKNDDLVRRITQAREDLDGLILNTSEGQEAKRIALEVTERALSQARDNRKPLEKELEVKREAELVHNVLDKYRLVYLLDDTSQK